RRSPPAWRRPWWPTTTGDWRAEARAGAAWGGLLWWASGLGDVGEHHMQPAGGQSSEAFGASTTMVRLRHGIEIDDDALREVCERNHVRELAIFGSALRSDFDTDSDIDVLVEFEPGVPIGMIALGRLQRELSTLIG